MKKKSAICFILIAVIMLISSCVPASERLIKNNDGYINVCGYPGLVRPMIDKFIELHPDFRYYIATPFSADGSDIDLESVLAERPPDIYFANGLDAIKCTKGDLSGYAMPYDELGINVEDEIGKAGIFQYIVDIGTRPDDGKVVGLSYQSSACAFIYRRSIAKEVWGTDDPAVVKTKIGPGWGKLLEAGAELEKKGYTIAFIPHAAGNGGKNWIVDGKLYIGPESEAYLDYAKEYTDEVYGPIDMTDATFFGTFGPAYRATNDLAALAKVQANRGDWAVCDPPVGYFENGYWVFANKELDNDPKKKAAVAEFIEWMTLDCTKQGLQYYMANGMLDFGDGPSGMKGSVASRTVMEMSDGKTDLLGGQDLFEAYISASQLADGKNITELDIAINNIWRKHVYDYAHGKCARFEAIARFKQAVKEQLGFDAWNRS